MTGVKLDHLAAVRVSGEDAGSYLQAQLTADISALPVGEACFSAYCAPKGNVLALIRVIRREHGFILLMARTLSERVVSELRKYVLRAQVEFTPLDVPIRGTREAGTLEYTADPSSDQSPHHDSSEPERFRAAELKQGITWLGPETSDAYLPQMLGFERLGAVSFRKGCFPGQEVIARVRYLGKVKQLPQVFALEGESRPAVGSEITLEDAGGESVKGVVVDSALDGEETVLFVITRAAASFSPHAALIGGARISVRENVQAWATM